MPRRPLAVSLALVITVVLAACGSGSPTDSPSAGPSTAAASSAPSTAGTAPSTAPTSAPTTGTPGGTTTTMTVLCDSVGVRKQPSTTSQLVVRIHRGSSVRVADTVGGDSYTAGACGSAGAAWLKIDRIDGKRVKTVYGVRYVYAAAGFFK